MPDSTGSRCPLLLLIAVLFTSPAPATPEMHPSDEARAGRLLLKGEHSSWRPAPALSSRADLHISGMIARVDVAQTFHNDSEETVEAVYVFPLPETAAVRAMRIRAGERIIEAEIRERSAAKQVYARAKAEGKRAGLLEQERANLFTTSVANIGPGESIHVELQYVETVRYQDGAFSLRFPMTITPRYIPGQALDGEASFAPAGEGWARATVQVPDAARITPLQDPVPAGPAHPVNPIDITAIIDAGLPLADVESAWHETALVRDGRTYRLSLRNGPVSMSRDFELRWRPQAGTEPEAALFTETVDGQRYLLLMLVPPAHATPASLLPREVVFVIDTSGSMGGVSMEQAREALLLALGRLRAVDRFNIIAFNDRPMSLFSGARLASAQAISQARGWVAALDAGGGTEMRLALELALPAAGDDSHLRQVVFLTDGAVGNEAALFQLIRSRLGASRLYTVGIGSAPNTLFMRKAAQFGRGTFTYIGSVREARARMDALFSRLESPVASDVEVQWPRGTSVEAYPARIPDLYLGEPLLLAARVSGDGARVTVRGRIAGKTWERRVTLQNSRDAPGIASVWARARIEELLDGRMTGRAEEAVRNDVLEVALAHRLVSPYTSFVAVDRTPGPSPGKPAKKSPVPNARPDGQSDQPYAWPRTATDSRWHLLTGLALLLLSLFLYGLRQAMPVKCS